MGVTSTVSRTMRSAGSKDPDPLAKKKTENNMDSRGLKVTSEIDKDSFWWGGRQKPDWSGFQQRGRREIGGSN